MPSPSKQAFQNAKRAVVQVGDGRGFVVSSGEYERYVITAAHCLPRHLTPHLANSINELTYKNILGPLSKEKTVWAELRVDNLVDDIAVLAEPDDQALSDEYERYDAFTFTAAAMKVGKSPENGTAVWVLSLDRKWQPCFLDNNGGRFLSIKNRTVESGMSGSPIIDETGAAIGLISTSSVDGGHNTNPSLTDCLPPWLLRKLDMA